MNNLTAAEAIEWLTSDKAFGQECYSRKQIAALIEQQAAEIAAANAELVAEKSDHEKAESELLNQVTKINALMLAERREREQAEAQCAAVRLRFEQYARNKCKLIAQFKGKLGIPELESGKCLGYAVSEYDDEPHYFCKECPACFHNDEEPDAGSSILDENRRMREALEKIRNCVTTHVPSVAVHAMDYIAKAALEGKP